jgi:AcrR family transcriptional regulator
MTSFSNEKQEYIDQKLLEVGREMFARYGLEKTTISDLTEPAGIANGTFYRFFESKEQLYFEVILRERKEFGNRVSELLDEISDPEQAIVEYLRLITEEIETNPLIQQLIAGGDWERLVKEFTEEELAQTRKREFDLLPYVHQWQDDGQLAVDDPETVVEAIDALTLISFHRDDIGETYPTVRDTLIRSVAAGLTAQSESDDSGLVDSIASTDRSTDQQRTENR